MRHRKDGRQFARNTSHRRAMFRNLAANLITHERIVTTDAKAKELRRVAERLITKAKHIGDAAFTPQEKLSSEEKAKRLHVSRQLSTFLPRWGVEKSGDKRDLVEKVMVDLAKRFKERSGGYTRIIKVGDRRGDGASMSMIEFVDATPVADEIAAAEAEEAAAEAAAADETEAEESDTDAEESDSDDEESDDE